MTQDPTQEHPLGAKIPAMGVYADEDFVEATEMDEAGHPSDEDTASNELHADADEVCAHCGQPIAPGTDVRKTVTGAYVHEMCPPHQAPS